MPREVLLAGHCNNAGGGGVKMENRGYSKLSRLSGVSLSHISRIMRGKVGVSLDTLIKLAGARHVSVERFLKDVMRSRSARRGGSDSE
jgi:transcriptional regulator with XRE-family HTH domain